MASQSIGLIMAIIISMNAMIGASIFTAPAKLQTSVGPAALITYALVIIAVWFMARSFAYLAQRYPGEGSFYTYASKWGGHIAGLFALLAYTTGLLVALGLLTRIVGSYLHTYFPTHNAVNLGIYALLGLVVLNLFGMVISSIGQLILIALTIFPILSITCLCLAKARLGNLTPFAPFGLTPILTSMKVVVFGFFGLECAPSLYKIVNNPQSNVPRALNYSVLLVGLIYTLFVGSIILALAPQHFTSATEPLSQVLLNIFPWATWLAGAIHISIIVTIMGTIHAMIWALSELLQSITKIIGIKSYKLSHNKAVIGIGLLTGLCCIAFSSIDLFFSLTAVGIVLAYALSILALLKNWRQYPIIQLVVAIMGISTAFLIFAFAAQGVLTELRLLPLAA